MGQNSYFSCEFPRTKKHFETVCLFNASVMVAELFSRALRVVRSLTNSKYQYFWQYQLFSHWEFEIQTPQSQRFRAKYFFLVGKQCFRSSLSCSCLKAFLSLHSSLLDKRVMFPPFFLRRKKCSICQKYLLPSEIPPFHPTLPLYAFSVHFSS